MEEIRFKHKFDYEDDTVISYESDNTCSKLKCSFTGEDPDFGTETIVLTAEPSKPMKQMVNEAMKEIGDYLDATDNGNMRRGSTLLQQFYDEYSNSTLYAVEQALTVLSVRCQTDSMKEGARNEKQ